MCTFFTIDCAFSIFRFIPQSNPPSYNIVIKSLTHHHSPRQVILIFKHMCQDNLITLDDFTFYAIFKACSKLQALLENQ
ncbi:hypothetical protein RIF29_10367 [Crotalaria pallida]|uniref:Pentatricopeptide repeat protein n=1 Tax=Crotalaria pallida TaxID=3830 RepID=A0AAN9FV64_CROPI